MGLVGLCLWLGANLAWSATAPVDSLAQRLRACTACHGSTDRVQADAFVPRLAGKPAGYLREQLQNFRTGRRHYAPMQSLLAGLPEAYLDEIAQHFAAAPHTVATPESTDTPARLGQGEAVVRRGDPARQVPACQACHGETLAGVAPAVPGLLGLPRNYLVAQLGAWRTGQRRARAPDCMAEVVRRLSDEDLGAAAAYLASRPLPAQWAPATQAPARWPLACGSMAAAGARP